MGSPIPPSASLEAETLRSIEKDRVISSLTNQYVVYDASHQDRKS